MKEQNSHRTQKEKPREHPTTKKRSPTRIFLRSLCPSRYAHEQVASTKTADQGKKEATGHSTGQH